MVACAWDGLTFFVDHDKNCVRFRFEDNVTIKAFCAGQYAVSSQVWLYLKVDKLTKLNLCRMIND